MNNIRNFYHYKLNNEQSTFISENTSKDLHIDELFEYIDFTLSGVGKQYLFAQLNENDTCKSFEKNEKIIHAFQTNSDFANQVKKEFKSLSGTFNVVALFSENLPTITKRNLILLNIMRFVPAFSLLMLFAFNLQWSIFLIAASIVVNTIIHYATKSTLLLFDDSIPQLKSIVRASKRILKLPQLNEFIDENLEATNTLQCIEKAASIFRVERLLQSDSAIVAWLVSETLKIFFLTEPVVFYNAVKMLDGEQKSIIKLYNFIGQLDVLYSTAILRTNAKTCVPARSSHSRLKFENIYHPLVPNCQTNSLAIQNKSILVTGSNMSGKSTFIRTIGINVLLAQNLNTCFADSFQTSGSWNIDSMIHVSDDLNNQKSLFMQEVVGVKTMLNKSVIEGNIFLLDELFKGTNTIERIAAAKAVLCQLVKQNNLVIVSTHDIELTEYLNSDFDLYHFCESVSTDGITFDYLLKEGILHDFNALRILETSGYDTKIIEDAHQTIKQLLMRNK